MGVIFESGYSLPGGDQPLTHARIAHSGNWLSGGTVTASSTATDFFADGPDNSLTYEKWQPTSVAATWQYTFSGSSSYDYCVIAAHNMGTQGNTLEVQTNATGSWTDLIPATAITDNMPIFCIFSEQTDTAARIRITNGSVPTIGFVKFGSAMQMARPLYGGHSPLDLSRQTVLRSTMSESGEFLGRSKQRSYNTTSFSWSNLSAAWVRTNWRPFQLAIETEPFVIAWRPGTFSEVGFCQTDSVPIPSNQGVRDLMSVEMQVRARGYD